MFLPRLISFLGLVVFIGIAWLFSERKKDIDWRLVLWGVGLQAIFALLILKTFVGHAVFDAARAVITGIINFSDHGARFVFGEELVAKSILAFKILPTIIFVSALTAVLYHFGIIQFVVMLMARIMSWTMGISGAEAFTVGLFVFMGIETVTATRAYLEEMTRSELFTIMSAFMATIAGGVMAAYVSFGASAGHLLAASVMSAPAAVLISKIMIPETGEPLTRGKVKIKVGKPYANTLDAAATGALDGLKLAAGIGAMLLVFISIIQLLNFLLNQAHTSFEQITSYLFSPFAFLMGVPLKDALVVGKLLGIKVVFNEFISYLQLKDLIAAQAISGRSVVIATYGLCSFANFGSIAILIGGIGGIAPSRRQEVASLGLKALAGGALGGFMTAAVVGMLL